MKTISDRQLQNAYNRAQQAGRDYADLCVADAMLRIRRLYPTAAVVRFTLYETDDAGWSANLVTIRDTEEGLLWHVDNEGEDSDLFGGDASEITDKLATAEAWGHDYFPRSRTNERTAYPSGTDLREVKVKV